MILFSNLPKLCEVARSHERVLDVGGWYRPFNLATHVVDVAPYETRQISHALDPENQERFSNDTWYQIDACRDIWPFEDKYFDFSVCSHTLEDVPDPVAVCRELVRVSKAGYIEVPSTLREIFTKQRWTALRSLLRMPLEIGFPHHLWMCKVEGSKIIFRRKDAEALVRASAFVTRSHIGRKLNEKESGACLWWHRAFEFEVADAPLGPELAILRKEALERIGLETPT